MHLPIRIILMVLLPQMLCSCLRGPHDIVPAIIPASEIEFLDYVKKGQDFARAGRMDLAEIEMRQALRVNTSHAYAFNDLGFALLGQNREQEAIRYFVKAIQLEPGIATYRTNLAKALYRAGEPEKSAAILEQMLEENDWVWKAESTQSGKEAIGNFELIQVLRDLSIIYYVLGYSDEAVCISSRLLDLNSDFKESVRHARLLLSLDRGAEALVVLNNIISNYGNSVSRQVYLDYVTALYSQGKYSRGYDVVVGLLADKSLAFSLRSYARVLMIAFSARLNKILIVEKGLEDLSAEVPEFCARVRRLRFEYWPYQLSEDVGALLGEYCEGSKLSLERRN